MATSEFWQRLSASVTSLEREAPMTAESSLATRGAAKFWMAFDVVIVVTAAAATTMYEFNLGLVDIAEQFWKGKLFLYQPMLNLGLLTVFTVSLILTSKRLHLYNPERISNTLNEQRMSLQACFTAGLTLIGTLYLLRE